MPRPPVAPARVSRRALLAGAVGAAVLAAAPVGQPWAGATGQAEGDPAALVLLHLNEQRIGRGLPPLLSDPHLATVAAGWSARMAGGMGLAHNPRHREEYGWPTERAGEVVAFVRNPSAGVEALAQTIVGVWLDSPSHRTVVLGDTWTDIGVGCAWGADGRLYATANTIRTALPAAAAEALALSQELIPAAGAPRIVIARCDLAVDALAASSLLGADAPLLLARPGQPLGAPLVAEISRAATPQTTVYLVGGGFPSTVEDQIRATGAIAVRLAGPSRYETAAAVAIEAARVRTQPWRVHLVHADAWADAVSVAGQAALHGTPVLLLDHGSVPAATQRVLDAAPGAARFVIGGDIADHVVDAIGGQRLAGGDRSETGAIVMTNLWERHRAVPGHAFVVTPGWTVDGWATALAHTSWAVVNDAPLLFSNDGVPQPVRQTLHAAGYATQARPTRFARHVTAVAQQEYRDLIGA